MCIFLNYAAYDNGSRRRSIHVRLCAYQKGGKKRRSFRWICYVLIAGWKIDSIVAYSPFLIRLSFSGDDDEDDCASNGENVER